MEQNLQNGIVAGNAAVNPHAAKNDLLQKLNAAYEVLAQAFGNFDEAARHSEIMTNKQAGKKKCRTWIIVFVILAGILPGYMHLLFLVVAIAFGLGYNKAKKDAAEAEQMVKAYQEKGERILNQNAEQLAFIPAEYQYPQAVVYLSKYLREDRADTLREAYKLYDNQCMQWKLDQFISESAKQAAVQSAYLASIRTGTIISATMSTVSAVHDLFNDK